MAKRRKKPSTECVRCQKDCGDHPVKWPTVIPASKLVTPLPLCAYCARIMLRRVAIAVGDGLLLPPDFRSKKGRAKASIP